MADVSVFGLGKGGVTLAACLGAGGNRVFGYDPDVPRLKAIRDRTLDVQEPGVPERLARLGADQLCATADPVAAVHNTRMTFIIVPTPSNPLGGFSLRYVLQAVEQVGAA